MAEVKVSGPQASLFGIVCILATGALFVLKVAGVIHASWWLVLAPLLVMVGIPIAAIAVVLAVAAVVAIVGSIVVLVDSLAKSRRRRALKKKAAARGIVTPLRMKGK